MATKQLVFNPFTGTFDYINTTGGGGGGTVTSVGGGIGIAASPEPITGAGTINLDIDSLTAEPSLAAGDEFAFVDVSVGTAPSAQRKVTFAQFEAALGGPFQPLNANLTDISAITKVRGGLITVDGGPNYVALAIGASGTVLTSDGTDASWQPPATSGTVTSISQGTGITLTPNPIISTGTVALADTAVTPGTYGDSTHVGQFTVDAQGRLTAATNVAIAGLTPTAWVQGGNAFGAIGVLGTLDAFPISIITNNVECVTIEETEGRVTIGQQDIEAFLTVGRGGSANSADATIIVKASSDPGAYPKVQLQNDTSVVGVWQYRPNGVPGPITDFLFSGDELHVSGTTGVVIFSANGDVWLAGNGAGGGHLFVGNVGTEFEVDDTGNIVKLNNVTTSFPAANSAGVLSNNGSGTYSIVANGSAGGGLPTCSANQTLRATGTDTWAASSVLLNDGTNLTDSGTLTVQGASITGGTAGTAFTATFGQGAAGTDNAGVVVQSGSGTNAESALSIQRNSTVECKLYANQASLTLCDFRTTFQFRDAANSGSVVMSLVDIVGIVAVTVGLGGTGTNSSTFSVNSGNSGTTAPIINLQRNNTNVSRWTHDGTDTFFDYTGNLNLRTSVGGTAKAVLDTNGAFTTYRNQTVVGSGVPAIRVSVALTGQSANIAATNLIASTAAAAMYRATLYYITTTTGNAVTITGQINYTDDANNAAVSFTGGTIAINTANAKQTATFTFQARSGTAITYQTNQSGALGAGRYALYIILERLS